MKTKRVSYLCRNVSITAATAHVAHAWTCLCFCGSVGVAWWGRWLGVKCSIAHQRAFNAAAIRQHHHDKRQALITTNAAAYITQAQARQPSMTTIS